MRRQQGFILLVVLLILQILALLSWYAMDAIVVEKKMIHHSLQQQVNMAAGEFLLREIENELMTAIPACTQNSRCVGHFQDFKYYYAIEKLGSDNCAIIIGTQWIAVYYRIHLSLHPLHSQPVLDLQSTVIRPGVRQEACAIETHAVQSGRQSWNKL